MTQKMRKLPEASQGPFIHPLIIWKFISHVNTASTTTPASTV